MIHEIVKDPVFLQQKSQDPAFPQNQASLSG